MARSEDGPHQLASDLADQLVRRFGVVHERIRTEQVHGRGGTARWYVHIGPLTGGELDALLGEAEPVEPVERRRASVPLARHGRDRPPAGSPEPEEHGP